MADIVTNTLQIGSNNLILQDAGARQSIATNTQDISDLKDGLSEIAKVGRANYSTSGYHNLYFNLVNGKSYKASVTSETVGTAVAIYTPDTQVILTVYNGAEQIFTANSDVEYLKLYFNKNVGISFTIEELDTRLINVEDAINSIENNLNAISVTGYETWVNQTNNWFDKTNVTEGQADKYYYSNIIPVVSGDILEMSYLARTNVNLWDQFAKLPPTYWYLYDESKNYIRREGTYLNPYTIPDGVKWVKAYFYADNIDANTYLIKKNELNRLYTPYSDPYPIYIQQDEKIVVPSNIYTAINQELNIYFSNFVRNGTYDKFERIWAEPYGSELFADRYIWNPSSASVKDLNIYGVMKSSYTPTLLSKTTAHAVATHPQAAKTVLAIGDSKIDNGQPTAFLKQMYSGKLSLIGTRYGNANTGDTTNRHEGRSGWSTKNYAMDASVSSLVNPFYNASYSNPTYGTHFDFATYMSNNGYSGVDVVFIMLGTNDTSDMIRNGELNPFKVNIDYLKGMIDSIHSYDSTIDVVVGLNEGVYCLKEEWHNRNYTFIWYNAEKIKAFDNRQSENIFVLGQYLDIDLINDYDVTEVPLSQADAVLNTGKTRPYTADGIHQNSVGYYKFAQCMDGILEYLSE